METPAPAPAYLAHAFPVSVKGVTVQDGKVLLLENERDEWELPGGKLELGEDPPDCVVREIGEETGWQVTARPLLDCWRLWCHGLSYLVSVIRRRDASTDIQELPYSCLAARKRLPGPEMPGSRGLRRPRRDRGLQGLIADLSVGLLNVAGVCVTAECVAGGAVMAWSGPPSSACFLMSSAPS